MLVLLQPSDTTVLTGFRVHAFAGIILEFKEVLNLIDNGSAEIPLRQCLAEGLVLFGFRVSPTSLEPAK